RSRPGAPRRVRPAGAVWRVPGHRPAHDEVHGGRPPALREHGVPASARAGLRVRAGFPRDGLPLAVRIRLAAVRLSRIRVIRVAKRLSRRAEYRLLLRGWHPRGLGREEGAWTCRTPSSDCKCFEVVTNKPKRLS